jgi:hypothetical protein
MTPTKTPALRALVAGALAILAGCSNTVNVASRRGFYDAYLDIPARAQAGYAEKSGLYKQIMDATQTPDANPYPALLADLQAMQRHVQDMTARRKSLVAFEGRFDQFASAHASVSPDQAADWAQFQGLDSQFQPLGQGMQVALQGYNDASNDFDRNVQAATIARLNTADVKSEVGGFCNEMDQALGQMEQKTKEDRKALEFASAAGGAPEVLHQKADVLEKMEKSLIDIEAFQRDARASADAVTASLPTDAQFWTGPGMDDDGAGLASMRAAHDGFRKRSAEFFSLSGRFDAVARPAGAPAGGDDHSHDHDHGGNAPAY